MSTYHGIRTVQCLHCGYATDDDTTMEMWNDYGGDCPICGVNRAEWTLDDGAVRMSDDEKITEVVPPST
jgi:hypothetical protein